ncbi:beta-microseminoprotein isoform X5 [Xenopus tropicalis]|nr:beta-microseminoprotein isoform X5 [Xenopus tropicalis]|eukprot:XP_002936005.1 PREDICTED: beta-microseminoprotein-like [Xenopus tropicalis]
MKCILAFVIALCILVTACNAACERSMPVLGLAHRGCLYDKELHKLGSKFRNENCQDCTCSMDGSLECCQAYGTPVDYDKEKCEAIFNKEACLYNVVEKKDHSKECEVYAMVG